MNQIHYSCITKNLNLYNYSYIIRPRSSLPNTGLSLKTPKYIELLLGVEHVWRVKSQIRCYVFTSIASQSSVIAKKNSKKSIGNRKRKLTGKRVEFK